MSNIIHGLTKDDLPPQFQRFFIPGDVILFSRWRKDPPLDTRDDINTDATPPGSTSSDASPPNDDTNASTGPQISCFSCLLDKFLCLAVFIFSSFTLTLLNSLLHPKETDFLAWSSFSSLSALTSTIPSAPRPGLPTFLILLYLFTLQITSLSLLLIHKFETITQRRQPPSHRHTRHLIERLTPYLPQNRQDFLAIWLRNLETLQEMYSNLYGSNHQNNINRYINQDPTQGFAPMEIFRDLIFHHNRWIVVRLAPYPLSPGRAALLRYLPCFVSEGLENLHQTYHYWQRTQAADGAFATLDMELEHDDQSRLPITQLEALFLNSDVEKRPQEYSRLDLNVTSARYGFFPRPVS